MMRTRSFLTIALTVLVGVGIVAAPAAAQDHPADRTLEEPERFGLVDPVSGIWHLEGLPSFYYGNPGDVPFMGDWDCDSVDTPGLYRQSDGYVYLRNSNDQGIADVRFFFGDPGDIPLAGDFDGDGCDSVSLYRPGESRVYLINRLGSADAGLGAADTYFTFGDEGDIPFAGDFDADGVDEVGVYRPASGLTYLKYEHRAGKADVRFYFGEPGDRVVVGDWDGFYGFCDETSCEGGGLRDTIAVYRPDALRFVVRSSNSTGPGWELPAWGEADWMPVAGRFTRHPADVLRDAMVGSWSGTGSLVAGLTFGVSFEFRSDGTYSATSENPIAMFWGGVNPPARTFRVSNVDPDGGGYGELREDAPNGAVSTMWLNQILVSDDGSRLTFVGHHSGSEVTFDLHRVG